MTASIEPRSGLRYGWDPDTDFFAPDLDANLLLLGRLCSPNLHVIDRTLTAPPGSPSTGDAYIPAASATGDWAGQDGNLAIWDGAAWVFYSPAAGWLVVVTAEGANGTLAVHTGTGWSAGIAL